MSSKPVTYLSPGDFYLLAGRVTGQKAETVERTARVDMVESALAVPASGYGGQEIFETIPEKTAALISRLVRNHGLPDANKRTALVAGIVFSELNGFVWTRPAGDELVDPDTGLDGGSTFDTMVALADRSLSEEDFTEWVSDRLTPALELVPNVSSVRADRGLQVQAPSRGLG